MVVPGLAFSGVGKSGRERVPIAGLAPLIGPALD